MGRRPQAFTATCAGAAAKAEFIAHQDPLHGWLEERCRTAAVGWTDRRLAYDDYSTWASQGGLKPLGKPSFYDLMRERFAETIRNGWAGYSWPAVPRSLKGHR